MSRLLDDLVCNLDEISKIDKDLAVNDHHSHYQHVVCRNEQKDVFGIKFSTHPKDEGNDIGDSANQKQG